MLFHANYKFRMKKMLKNFLRILCVTFSFQSKRDSGHSEDIPLSQIDLSVPLHVPGNSFNS